MVKYAAGMGGQYLCLVPERDMIIVATGSGAPGDGSSHKTLIRFILQSEAREQQKEKKMKKNLPEFDREAKKVLAEKIIAWFDDELEMEIGNLKADLILDYMTELVGKESFNQGVSLSRRFLLKKMEDVEIDMDQLLL